MNRDLMLLHLYAMRAQLDVLIASAEQEAQAATAAPPTDPNACPDCGAPEDQQQESSTLGDGRKIVCLRCRKERAA